MRDVLTRQLIAPAVAMLLFCAAISSHAGNPRDATVIEQLQAAKLMQAALAARSATPDDWRKLDETYAALISRHPRDVTVRNARAEFFWSIGEQPSAVKEWETAEQIDPKNSVVLEHLGNAALALGDARKSAAFFARAVASDPMNAACHFALANVWFVFRHELLDAEHPSDATLLAGALAHFAEASRLAPGNADYSRAYAETFYSVPKPDWAAALAAWETVQRLSPQKDFALLHQARVHLKMGHPDAAIECLSKVQSPDYQILKAKLQAQAKSQSKSALKHPSSHEQFGPKNPR